MGCGSPLGDLFYLADALLASGEWRACAGAAGPGVAGGASPVARHPPLVAELYRMYGEAQIGEEVFAALRALADRGQLGPADLAVHRARAQRRPAGRGDPALASALRGIHSRLAQLAQVRAASEKVLADLETRLADLGHRIADKERGARETVERDEGIARRRLAEKAELASGRDRLTEQARALRADLAQLDDLRAQLEIKAAELEAVRARSRLAEEVLK